MFWKSLPLAGALALAAFSGLASAPARAEALLDRAEAFYRDNGQRAHAAFSRSGEFRDGPLYVYVLDLAGNFLASGGSSVTLIGRNVRDMPDARGKPFFSTPPTV